MNKASSQQEESLTLTRLKKEYRLSQEWLERLGDPDIVKPNPHYPSAGAPMKLWRKNRVEAFLKEHAEEYQAHFDKSLRRRATRKAVATRAAQETLDYAQSVEICLVPFPRNLKKACAEHLVERALAQDHIDGEDFSVTDRKIVNMLRHRYTNYEELLDPLRGCVGRWKAYPIIKKRVIELVCAKASIPLTADISGDSDREFVRRWWREGGSK